MAKVVVVVLCNSFIVGKVHLISRVHLMVLHWYDALTIISLDAGVVQSIDLS